MVDSFDATQLAQLELRPTGSDDQDFARNLFASTYAHELADLGDVATALLEQQYQAWLQNLAQYPRLRDEMIVLRETPIGRLVIAETKTQIRLVDIAIDPAFRRRGIGTHILRSLQARATEQRRPIELRVRRSNRAQSLYARLGFQVRASDAAHLVLRWESSLPE